MEPNGLDFIESGFSETAFGLFWVGEVGGKPISIYILLPPMPGVYAT